MPNPSYTFRISSNISIIVNIIIGISSIFLIERLIPIVENIVKENSYTLNATMDMINAMVEENQDGFWLAFENAKTNVTISGEKMLVDTIELNAKQYWQEPSEMSRKMLVLSLTDLSKMNLSAIEEKDQKARFFGVSGAWTIGFATFIAFVFQLLIRNKISSQLMEPVSDLIDVIHDFLHGRKLRRFTNVAAHHEIKNAGKSLNKILDQSSKL